MSKNLSIHELLSEIKKFEKFICDSSDEILIDDFVHWSSLKQRIGETLVDEAIITISKKIQACIVAKPVNPSSYGHILRSDVQSKDYHIRERTNRYGLSNGFLSPLGENSLKKHLCFELNKDVFFAVKRNGLEILVKDYHSTDNPLYVACNNDAKFIVSDVDLISIVFKGESGDFLQDPIFGEITSKELELVKDINLCFQALLEKHEILNEKSSFRLISHGPANRFSKSKISHVNSPLKAYLPSCEVKILESENNFIDHFLSFNEQLQNEGYKIHHNSCWELVN